MQAVFEDINFLDRRCVEKFGLSEDLMMEHAASSIERYIKKHLPLSSSLLILCGPGNNGADGIALARMLQNDYRVHIYLPLDAQSKMAKIQLERAKKVGVKITNKLLQTDCYVDAMFGSGLSKPLSHQIASIIKKINQKNALKIACDIPSGIMQNGNIKSIAFQADATITMGALKSSLFSDMAKNYLGSLHVSNLGVSRTLYEIKADTFLLERCDLNLPTRNSQTTHKGDFGHLAVVCGTKEGASLLCAEAGFAFGAGLVSLVGESKHRPIHIMQTKTLPKNTTALACGMGLGAVNKKHENLLIKTDVPMVLDADMLTCKELKKLLHVKKNAILTPHPKEFSQMLSILDIDNKNTAQIQQNRLQLAREFSKHYPQVLVLKGANTIIAHQGICYISDFGTQALAKGGSGDVLAGLIASLLAQKYNLLESAISGVLAHGVAAKNYTNNSYSLKPQDIIEEIKCL